MFIGVDEEVHGLEEEVSVQSIDKEEKEERRDHAPSS